MSIVNLLVFTRLGIKGVRSIKFFDQSYFYIIFRQGAIIIKKPILAYLGNSFEII